MMKNEKKNQELISCSCDNLGKCDPKISLRALLELREHCPVLKEIFIPDKFVDDYEQNASKPNLALHKSILLMALEQGFLGRLLKPFHHYLITDNKVDQNLEDHYSKALIEKWFIKADAVERHTQSRGFMGKIYELHLAYFLKSQGYQIKALEALGGSFDIETNKDSDFSAWEVKYIGMEDQDFNEILVAINPGLDKSANQHNDMSPYIAANYLLVRVYDAAKQLSQYDGKKVVAILISQITLKNFDFPLKHEFIDWQNPQLIDNREFISSVVWTAFINKPEYRNISNELKPLISSLDQIRIYVINDYVFKEIRTINL